VWEIYRFSRWFSAKIIVCWYVTTCTLIVKIDVSDGPSVP